MRAEEPARRHVWRHRVCVGLPLVRVLAHQAAGLERGAASCLPRAGGPAGSLCRPAGGAASRQQQQQAEQRYWHQHLGPAGPGAAASGARTAAASSGSWAAACGRRRCGHPPWHSCQSAGCAGGAGTPLAARRRGLRLRLHHPLLRAAKCVVQQRALLLPGRHAHPAPAQRQLAAGPQQGQQRAARAQRRRLCDRSGCQGGARGDGGEGQGGREVEARCTGFQTASLAHAAQPAPKPCQPRACMRCSAISNLHAVCPLSMHQVLDYHFFLHPRALGHWQEMLLPLFR